MWFLLNVKMKLTSIFFNKNREWVIFCPHEFSLNKSWFKSKCPYSISSNIAVACNWIKKIVKKKQHQMPTWRNNSYPSETRPRKAPGGM